MTSPELVGSRVSPPVPPWALVTLSGEVHRQRAPYHHPTALIRGNPGSVLGVKVGALWAILAGSEVASSLEWITTVDMPIGKPGMMRYVAPGVTSSRTVRLWVHPSGYEVILTDGPLEQALQARAQFMSGLEEADHGRAD